MTPAANASPDAGLLTSFYSSWAWVALLSVVLAWALLCWGRAFLATFERLRMSTAEPARSAEAWSYGVLGFSVLGFAGVLAGVSLVATFVAGSAVVFGAWLLPKVSPMLRADKTRTRAANESGRKSIPWVAPTAVLLGSLVWSINNFRGLEQSGDDLVLVPWVDFFFHARQISNFARFDGDAGALHWTMYGQSLPPYHYASYVFSALVARVGDVSAIQAATSVYPVIGMMLTGAAMIVLAQGADGRRAATLAVALLFFLPDLSCWVPGFTRQYSYFFFQQVGVGGAYAVALLGLSVASVFHARRTGSTLHSAWALVLLLLSALFKIQLALAYGVFVVVLIVSWLPRLRPSWRAALVVLTLAAFWLAVNRMAAVPNAPTLDLSLNSIGKLFHLDSTGPMRIALEAMLLPAAAVIVWTITYGLIFILLIGLLWLRRRDSLSRDFLFLAALFLLANIYVRLLISDNRGFGDIGEINRKTFVLPYFMVAFTSATLLCKSWRENNTYCLKSRSRLPVLLLGAVLLVAFTVFSAFRLQYWPGYSAGFSNTVVPRGLAESAAYLRMHAAPNHLVQLCENDHFNQLATLSERPVHIAKLVVNAAPASAEERRRFGQIGLIGQQLDFASARRLAAELGIRWWLMTPGCRSSWETGKTPSLNSDGYRLFDFR